MNTRSKRATVDEAIGRIPDGSTIMVGGFGFVGQPLSLINGLIRSGKKDLTIIANNLGEAGKGLGILLRQGQVKKAVGTYFTHNPEVAQAVQERRLDVEVMPQGTFVEAIRAQGAGLGGFYTPTAAGTLLANGKEVRLINGREYLFQAPIRADVALIRAWRADESGNLVYRKTAQNFNTAMATAADLVIAEVDEIVQVGGIDAEDVITPQLFVDLLVLTGGGH